jgi:nitronate monooxygenase
METSLTQLLGIKYPIIMAPMFLVTNTEMMIESLNNGIAAAVPALNYRTDTQFRKAIEEIKQGSEGPIGVNLIVNKSNIKLNAQLKTCLELKVSFIITSLGSPEDVIKKCKPLGIKVFCDVIDLKYAQKVEQLGADGVIAVNKNAGGHCGPTAAEELIPLLKKNCNIPVISAGGISKKGDLAAAINLGADGVSVGTVFIATKESPVSEDYKNACINYGEKDIVLSNKLSGSHLTVINTPYVQELGTEPNFLERLMKKHKWLKKWIKMIIMLRGMKKIEQAAFGSTYKTVWCAGPSIEDVKEIRSVKEVIKELIS